MAIRPAQFVGEQFVRLDLHRPDIGQGDSAVFTDGSFCFIPKGVACPMDLSTYFRINNKESGQFERTLIVAEEGASVSYLEGCTAPQFDTNQLHAAVVELVAEVAVQGLDLQAISAGGGLSIPYQAGEPQIDTAHYFSLWDAARQQIAALLGHAVALEIEPGRYLVAESGVLVTEVRATKTMGSNPFVMVDAGFSDLMRPSMYGSFHGMTLMHADGSAVEGALQDTVVGGPLCESGDVFTQGEGGVVLKRPLPVAQVGDLLVLHDTGAYGASMSSNYNTRPLIAEVLVEDGQARLIRRRQTVGELLALEAV